MYSILFVHSFGCKNQIMPSEFFFWRKHSWCVDRLINQITALNGADGQLSLELIILLNRLLIVIGFLLLQDSIVSYDRHNHIHIHRINENTCVHALIFFAFCYCCYMHTFDTFLNSLISVIRRARSRKRHIGTYWYIEKWIQYTSQTHTQKHAYKGARDNSNKTDMKSIFFSLFDDNRSCGWSVYIWNWELHSHIYTRTSVSLEKRNIHNFSTHTQHTV